MAKVKKKLTRAQKRARKAAKAELQKKYECVFINGKQVRITRSPTIDGIPVDQFVEKNTDAISLHQKELWELIPIEGGILDPEPSVESDPTEEDDEIPF